MPEALVSGSNTSGHDQNVQRYLEETLARYGVDNWSVVVSETEDLSGYDLVVYGLSSDSVDDYVVKGLWQDHNVPSVNGHGSNALTRLEKPLFGERHSIHVGGEDPSNDDAERSYGPGLELDAITYDESTAESYTTPTVAALWIWLYEQHTDATLPNRARWLDARALLRSMTERYPAWREQGGYGVLYGAAPDGGDTYSAEAQAQVDRLPATAPLQPPMNVRSTDLGDGEVFVEWLPYRSSAQAATVIERAGEIVYRGDDTQTTLVRPWRSGDTLTLRSEDAQGVRSHEASYATLDVSSYSYEPPTPVTPGLKRDGREVTLVVEPAPYDREVDVSTSLGATTPDATRALPAGTEEVTHTLSSEAQSARYRLAVLSGDGRRIGVGAWAYIAGATSEIAPYPLAIN